MCQELHVCVFDVRFQDFFNLLLNGITVHDVAEKYLFWLLVHPLWCFPDSSSFTK